MKPSRIILDILGGLVIIDEHPNDEYFFEYQYTIAEPIEAEEDDLEEIKREGKLSRGCYMTKKDIKDLIKILKTL